LRPLTYSRHPYSALRSRTMSSLAASWGVLGLGFKRGMRGCRAKQRGWRGCRVQGSGAQMWLPRRLNGGT
jgi:hypothetical protein